MSQPRRNGVKLSFYVSPELRHKIIDYQQTKEMKDLSEAENDLLEKGLANAVDFITLNTCDFRSRLIGHPEWADCKKGKRVIRGLIAEMCVKCKLNLDIIVPLVNTKEKLETQINLHRETLQEIGLKIDDANSRYSQATVPGLREENESLETRLKSAQHTITHLNSQLENYKYEVERLHKSQPYVSEPAPTQPIPIESKPVFHRNVSTTENPPIQKVEANPQIVKRVIEQNTTTTKKTTEFVTPQQQKLPPPIQQKAPLPPEIILCPEIKETVNIEETCKGRCDHRDTCKYYLRIVVNKAITTQ